ncbi:MAG TPA: alpha/beta fold hydrolase [Verrucomicrobiae bacterium]|nr:alpha/beta fold hydrolase [Verrucomicrobiae bacterium]
MRRRRQRSAPLRWLRAARQSVRRFSRLLRLHADPFVSDPPAGVAERWIETRDGVRLHAWYAPAARAAATLVWSHGTGVSIARRPHLLRALAARGLNVLAYDYRSCGRSGGRSWSERGLYLDALAAYDSERARGVPPEHIISFGESIGGAVAVYLASRRPCAGLVVVSSCTRVRDVPRGIGPLWLLVRLNSIARIPGVRVPVFVAHGDRDRMFPFELGERLFAAANHPKTFFRAAGAGHDDVLASPGLLDAIAEFSSAAAAPPACARYANG